MLVCTEFILGFNSFVIWVVSDVFINDVAYVVTSWISRSPVYSSVRWLVEAGCIHSTYACMYEHQHLPARATIAHRFTAPILIRVQVSQSFCREDILVGRRRCDIHGPTITIHECCALATNAPSSVVAQLMILWNAIIQPRDTHPANNRRINKNK
jgi:hypothetical protein